MTLVMLAFAFFTSSIKSGKRKLNDVCEKTMKKENTTEQINIVKKNRMTIVIYIKISNHQDQFV